MKHSNNKQAQENKKEKVQYVELMDLSKELQWLLNLLKSLNRFFSDRMPNTSHRYKKIDPSIFRDTGRGDLLCSFSPFVNINSLWDTGIQFMSSR